METIGTPLFWGGFITFILAMLAIDLGVFNRDSHEVKTKEALGWVITWATLAAIFGAGVFWKFGPDKGMEYATGYLLELALSVDNMFVFVLVFSALKVPAAYQHRVLFWGILSALVLRAVFIGAGAVIVSRFHWVLYVFGALLVITGAKMLLKKEGEEHSDPEKGFVLRTFRRFVPMTAGYHGNHFFARENGILKATPLLAVLVLIEFTDVLFAVDSIPAIFGITSDPFVIFTSNIFAILGLRSMYFLLAGIVGQFRYLQTGLALVLAFIGVKMLVSGVFHVPVGISLGVVAGLIAGSVLLSVLRKEVKTVGADAKDEQRKLAAGE